MAMSCNTAQLVDTWKNPEIDAYSPTKVLVVGITSDIEARKKFEQQIKAEYESRGAEAVMSLDRFDPSLRAEKMSEEEIEEIETNLIKDGFDTILLTKVIGVEDKIKYREDFDGLNQSNKKFREDYLMYQDIFYNPDYYEEYSVYHAETSMYCICPTKDRELIWKGYINIVAPESTDATVNDYVKLVIAVLQEEQLVNPVIDKKLKKEEETL